MEKVRAKWRWKLSIIIIYFFIKYTTNKTGQIQATVDYLSNSTYGMLWLDVEGAGSYWGDDYDYNVNFIQV